MHVNETDINLTIHCKCACLFDLQYHINYSTLTSSCSSEKQKVNNDRFFFFFFGGGGGGVVNISL